VLAAVKLNLAGRVSLISGDAQEILLGITCYTGGKPVTPFQGSAS
jgi:hypothetical protein